MNVVKGSWIGQTFALAKSNESGGKKSRIRRSKEERKEMVASFIKKYQSLNNGSFPSLNLTHKEVGGSFYTVREIVRDIIQENRVLGPAKLLPGEHSTDVLLEQYPLGTISTQPHSSSSASPNGTPLTADQFQSFNQDAESISDDLFVEAGLQGFDNGNINDGKHVVIEELVEQNKDGQVSELPEAEDNKKEVAVPKANVTQMTDVIVETSPLRTIEPTDYFDGILDGLKDLNQTLEEKDGKEMQSGPGNDISFPDVLSSMKNTLESDQVDNLSGTLFERNKGLMDGKPGENLKDLKLGSSTSSSTSVEDMEYEKPKYKPLEKSSSLMDETSGGDLAEIAKPVLEGLNLSTTEDGFVQEEPADASLEQRSGFLDSKVIDGKHVVINNKEQIEQKKEGQVSKLSESGESMKKVAVPKAKVTPVTDVIVETFPLRPLTKPSDYLDSKSVENIAHPKLGSSNSPSMEADAPDSRVDSNVEAIAETQVLNTPNGMEAKTIDDADSKSKPQELVVESKADGQHVGGSKRESNPTLSRINLESWQGAAKKPARPEDNPLWGIFKSLADFLKLFFE
ncbi:hypothetical protein Tsubulata_029284 [Turnera subulata]|uniref:AT3G52170-like helix-turn-helix domain-containing protein n=1 Tax=Turnera subulata TaxID=218843 RepID=A0A9Q0FTQ2_9ROSI|nr:hypothetical protein Tsubulata_029284 [Turnera subulata]